MLQSVAATAAARAARITDADATPTFLSPQVGLRGYFACRQLMLQGHTAYNITGGWKSYKDFKEARQLQGGAAAINGAKL